MKKQYFVVCTQQMSLRMFEAEKTSPGGWYYANFQWYGPGVALHSFEIDFDDRNSKGNPEFSPGDLVCFKDEQGIYIKTLPGRRTSEIFINGATRKVSRNRIGPSSPPTDE